MLNMCRGGRGVPAHKEISFEGDMCPWCKDREAMFGKVADLMEKISDLEVIIAKLEGEK
jgi:hypothetical protein